MAIEGLQRSDAELLTAVREGDAEAFGALYDRHAVAALTVARQYTDSAADAEDVVADSFTAVYNALCRGKGPAEAFRAYLFTVVRRVATVRRDHGRRVRATDDVAALEAGAVPMAGADAPALAGFESTVVARAFATLPERWQLVLWHTEVEGLAPAQVAPLLGLSANSASALAYRAREGLRQAYLTEHLADGLDDRCRPVADKLGAYVRGGLGPRESRKVAAHLDDCSRCTALYVELGDVNHGMRAIVAPLVLGIAGLGALDQLLPVGGGLAALGGLPGLTDGGTGAAAGGSAGSWAGSAGAGAGRAVAGASTSVPVVGVVAAAVVGLAVAVSVAVFALVGGGRPTSSAGGASTAAASSSPDASSPDASPSSPDASPEPDTTPTLSDKYFEAPDQVGVDPTSPLSSQDRTGPSDQADRSRPVVAVDISGSLLALRAGESDQELRLAVHNSGDEVTGLAAAVTLPDGVTLEGVPGVDGGGRSAPGASWGCLPTSAQSASCALARLATGATSVLTLRVSVGEEYDGTGGDLELRFSGGQVDLAPIVVPVTVASAPARTVVTARAPAELVVGRTRTLTLDVTNAGGSAGRALVVLRLPYGIHLGGPSPDGWTCLPRGLREIGCAASLDKRTSLPLELPLATRAGVSPGVGLINVTHTPANGGTLAVPYTVLRPATLVVTPPAGFGLLATGTTTDLPLTVTNTGGLGSAAVTLDVTLPTGVVPDDPLRGDGWTCGPRPVEVDDLGLPDVVAAAGQLAETAATTRRCSHDGLASGASTVVTLPLTGNAFASGDVAVTVSAEDADGTSVLVPVQVTAPETSSRAFTGNVRVVHVGAPLLSCVKGSTCPDYLTSAEGGRAAAALPEGDPPTTPSAEPVSSSTTLYLSGQDVLWAGLYWSANAGQADAWSADRTVVQLRGPGAAYRQVTSTATADVADSSGRRYYQSFADVTTQVRSAGGGTWSLSDAAFAASATDPDLSYYAGWALVVVYGSLDAAGPRTVTVHDSGQLISTAAAQTVLTVPTTAERLVTVGAVAWEGDAATSGDRLLLDGVALTPRGGSPSNAFDSTATGWGHASALGVDAKTFRPVTARSDLATLTASTTDDQYLLGVATVTVHH